MCCDQMAGDEISENQSATSVSWACRGWVRGKELTLGSCGLRDDTTSKHLPDAVQPVPQMLEPCTLPGRFHILLRNSHPRSV